MTTINKKFFVGAFIAAFAFAVASANAAYMHTVTLKQGSTGSQVMSLQQTLNMTSCKVSASGAGAPGMETTAFGPKTKVAVQCFQASNGLTADGVVGPMTGSVLAAVTGGSTGGNYPAGCTSAAGFSPTTGQPCNGSGSSNNNGGSLSGGAGDLESAELISSISNEDVGEDEEDVKVLGLELEADNGSDLSFTSIRVEFEEQGAGGSDDLEDYATEVTVWLGSTQVGSADVEDFDEDDGIFNETITLSNAVVDAGESEDLFVAVTAANNIDSDDLGSSNNDWDVGVVNLRYVDAQGAVVTENSLDDIGSDLSTDEDETEDFQFVSFASAADVELIVDENGDEDDINNSHTVTVDADDETEAEPLLAFTLEAEGDSDITVIDLPVHFLTNDTNISTVISEVSLFHGDDEIASEDIDGTGTSEVVTFEDLDIVISAGDEEEFWIKATILDQDGNYTSGTATLVASVGSAQTNAIDAEDESETELENSPDDQLTGSATGGTLTLSTSEAVVTIGDDEVTGTSTDSDDAYEYGTYTFEITISAEGDDAVTFDADDDIDFTILGGSDSTATSINFYKLSGDATDNGSNSFTIADGDDATFSFSVVHDPDSAGNYRVRLDTVVGQDMADDEYTSTLTLSAS